MSSRNQSGKKKQQEGRQEEVRQEEVQQEESLHPWAHIVSNETVEELTPFEPDGTHPPVLRFSTTPLLNELGFTRAADRSIIFDNSRESQVFVNGSNLCLYMHPYHRCCMCDLQLNVRCYCVHWLTEVQPYETIVSVWRTLADLRMALEMRNADPMRRLSVVFGVLRLLPAADDGCIRFCFRGGQHSSQTFCVNALRNYLGPNFVDLYRTVTKEDMEELAVEQQQPRNG
jgi:hypothetical protein